MLPGPWLRLHDGVPLMLAAGVWPAVDVGDGPAIPPMESAAGKEDAETEDAKTPRLRESAGGKEDAKTPRLRENAAGKWLRESASAKESETTFWIEIWGPYHMDVMGMVWPLDEDHEAQAQKLRVIGKKGRAGEYGEDQWPDMEGWVVGARRTGQFGVVCTVEEDGSTVVEDKLDLRWLLMRPPIRRYPLLVPRLERLEQRSGYQRFWWVPMKRMQHWEVLQLPGIQAALKAYEHPRMHLIVSSVEERIRHMHTVWRASKILFAPCGWCAEPTELTCPGPTSHMCRKPLCYECRLSLVRCPRCIAWVGLPPAYDPTVVEEFTAKDWYEVHRSFMHGPGWCDVWDGESPAREYEEVKPSLRGDLTWLS